MQHNKQTPEFAKAPPTTQITEEELYEAELRYAQAARVYLSGKISGLENLNKPKFEDAEVWLSNYLGWWYRKDFIVVNPHKLPRNHDGKWHSYMRECLKALCRCEAIYMLDDWKDSKGAIVELFVAKILNLKLYDFNTLEEIKISYRSLLVKLLMKL